MFLTTEVTEERHGVRKVYRVDVIPTVLHPIAIGSARIDARMGDT